MANKFQEQVTASPVSSEPDFNPLDEAVNEKKYSQPNVNASGIDFTKPIEEPKFTPPPFQKKPIGVQQPQQKAEPINPDLKNIPKKEQDASARQAAKMIIQGYEWLHDFANRGLQVSEKKLAKLQAEGEINLNAMISYDYGKQIRAGEFFQEYNKQIDGLLKVSDEFKEEVTPVLERVLSKRGIGLTDEQLLMYLVGKDIAAKSIIFFNQKQQIKYMIETIKQASMAQPMPEPQPEPQQPAPEDFAPKEKPSRERPMEDKFEYGEIITEKEDDYIKSAKEKSTATIVEMKPIEKPKRKRGRPKL